MTKLDIISFRKTTVKRKTAAMVQDERLITIEIRVKGKPYTKNIEAWSLLQEKRKWGAENVTLL